MWPRRRRGKGGKSARILDLIDNYWDQIEGDFAHHLNGIDARAWVRGERHWDQFLNYCITVAQIDGSQLRSAQLRDDRYDDEIEKILDSQPDNPRPPLEGDTAEVRELRAVRNDIRLLIRALGAGALPVVEGPVMPADRLQKKRRDKVFDHFDELLG